MGSSLSEPCIYDKLSESIDILRQSGYRYGMSEREIEKFIKQVLETNEPRRDPPQFPILRATIKGGESLSRRVSHLEQFSRPQTVTPTPANFTLLWSFSSSPRETVLQWLFPDTELCPLLENTGTTLQRCQITDSTNAQHTRVQVLGWLVVAEGSPSVRVLPVQRCQNYCSSFSLWLEPGDMVYADPRYWLMELFPSGGQSVLCDGPVL
ncbi:bombesin receptor-activated C6orf89-like protein [Labeo rohita]|uniref:Bombesin receptor-activated C6orf89-like protein n=1 Tax=Labeo rohita TaxID=84645 RepID=A0A498LG53_LABRO|nr:bombesin receptor-activated C6orf89-like protein [Labeo rohita]